MKFLTVAALALFAAAPVMAVPLTIDFETVPAGYVEPVGDHYAYTGVRFSQGATALQNDANFTYYSGAPSSTGVLYLADQAVMNVAGGFIDMFSFWYTASEQLAGAIKVYSGLDGSGTELASFDLLTTNAACTGDVAFCAFEQLSMAFVGTARSVVFDYSFNVAYDDLSFNYVPEPTSALLMGLGLAGLAAARRRRK